MNIKKMSVYTYFYKTYQWLLSFVFKETIHEKEMKEINDIKEKKEPVTERVIEEKQLMKQLHEELINYHFVKNLSSL